MEYISSTKASDYFASRNLFILSDINSAFIKKHNIKVTAGQFKKLVRLSEPLKYVLTGAYGYTRKTAVYSLLSFSNLIERIPECSN